MLYGFPDENIDPKKKLTKEWMEQYCKAALYNYNNLPIGSIGWVNRGKYDEYSLYARGSQPVAKYKRTYNNGEDGENKLLVVDWRVLPILAKLMTIVNGLLSDLSFRPQINPIDDLAKDEMEEQLLANEAKILMRKQLQLEGGAPELMNLEGLRIEEGEAEDLDDLGVKELGLRHHTAMELEEVVESVFNHNDVTSLMEQWNMDWVKYGVAVRKSEIVNDSNINILREDPRHLVISYCIRPDFSDWRYVGLIRSIPVSELITMSKGELTKSDIELMYQLGASGMQDFGLSNYDWGQSITEFYNRGSVYVLDIEIRSTDKKVLEIRKTKTGNMAYNYTNPEGKRNKDNEYSEAEVENVYCAKWVVGTDIVFNIYKQRNMKRDSTNLSRVEPSIRVYGCDVWNMMAKSRVEELIAYADGIQYAYYKLQHILNSKVPPGYAINYDALESVDLGAGASKMTPKDVMDLFFDRGILVHRSQGLGTEGKTLPPPIVPISNGVLNEMADYWTMINTNIALMKETIGLNDLTDGSTPNAKTLTEIARAAQGGTKNALSDIYANQRRLIKDLTKDTVKHCQYLVKDGNSDLLAYSLGDGSMKRLRNIKDIDKYLYSVSIQENPTQEELISLNEQIKIGQQNGEITVSDVFMLDNMTNIKQKQAFLAVKVKKNIAQKQQEALQLQQQNGQIQVQSAQMAEQAKQQTLTLEYQLKTQHDLAVIEAQKELEAMKGQFNLEAKRIDASGRVGASEVQALGRDINNKRDNTTKLMTTPEGGPSKEDIVTIVDRETLTDFPTSVLPQTANEEPLELQEFDFTKSA